MEGIFIKQKPEDGVGYLARFREEVVLLIATLHRILLAHFILQYGAHMVFRNIAFYRYPDYVDPSLRLKDWGFETVPAFPHHLHTLGDKPK